MDTKKMVTNAILIAVGAILHQITPGVGIQADLSLAMLFIIMVYNREYKTTVICGLIVGVFAALTSKTAGGQLPNIIDKLVTCNIMYLVLLPLRDRVSKTVQIMVLLPIGTVLSGTVFLTSLMLLGGLPAASFGGLFLSVVLITAVVNCVVGFVLFKIVGKTALITNAYSSQK